MEIYKNDDGTIRRRNGGWCDVDDGPCACGAWHKVEEFKPEERLHPNEENPFFNRPDEWHLCKDILPIKYKPVLVYSEDYRNGTRQLIAQLVDTLDGITTIWESEETAKLFEFHKILTAWKYLPESPNLEHQFVVG